MKLSVSFTKEHLIFDILPDACGVLCVNNVPSIKIVQEYLKNRVMGIKRYIA